MDHSTKRIIYSEKKNLPDCPVKMDYLSYKYSQAARRMMGFLGVGARYMVCCGTNCIRYWYDRRRVYDRSIKGSKHAESMSSLDTPTAPECNHETEMSTVNTARMCWLCSLYPLRTKVISVFPSVCLSVCPSVCLLSVFHCHRARYSKHCACHCAN